MIYVTGTTRGLGKALYGELCIQNRDVFGLNRPEYELGKNLRNYIKTDFEMFILNAHHDWDQVNLLYKLFEANMSRKCSIITISSVSADGDRKEVNEYAIQKKALDAACTQLQLVKSNCTITNVKLGRVDTDMVKDVDAKKMDPDQISRAIIELINVSSENFYIKTVTIDNV